MKVVIIEDESFAADALEKIILDLRPKTDIQARLESIEESVEYFMQQPQADLIFCDIHLSDGSSFEIFRQIEIKIPVIFTTAYNEYAIEAFKVNSIDYLLKPLKKEEVARAIKKFEELQKEDISLGIENLRNLLKDSSKEQEVKSRFMVKSGQTIKSIPSDEVAYFLAEEGVVLLFTFDGKRYIVNYTLEQLNDQLEPKKFFKVNRHLITNIEAVNEVSPYFKGRLHLTLDPPLLGEQIISSSKASAFKQWLDL